MEEDNEENGKVEWTQNDVDYFLEALKCAENDGSRSRWKYITSHNIYGPYFTQRGINKKEMNFRYRHLSKQDKNFAPENFPRSLERIVWSNDDENELLKAVDYAHKNSITKQVFQYILNDSQYGEYFSSRNFTHAQMYAKYKLMISGTRSHATKITKDRISKKLSVQKPKVPKKRRRWTKEELNLFRAGMLKHGRKWSAIIDDELFSELYTKYGRDNEDLRLKARDDEMRRDSPIFVPAESLKATKTSKHASV